MFQNLIDNAIKYSDENTVVRIVTRESHNPFSEPGKHDNRYIEIAIIDQGAGISPEIQLSIFDPFVQAKRDGKGSGLGLWIAKLIVESSGGILELESEPGQGSVFRISLGMQDPDQ